MTDGNVRPLEAGMADPTRSSYAGYLKLDQLLSAQVPLSDHHDELVFIIQHQTTELWIKLVVHELRSAMALLAADDVRPALKRLARVKHVQKQMTDQWSVLATLTPSEYLEFRHVLGTASGFQSVQYRLLEMLLGNKNAQIVDFFADDEIAHRELRQALERPSLYDEFLMYLSRHGYPIPPRLIAGDWTRPHELDAELVTVLATIYAAPEDQWEVYEFCEELVDVEETFQTWRFRHLKTVERIIGNKRGTGGSSGVGFLQKALSLTFFPELYAVRTQLG